MLVDVKPRIKRVSPHDYFPPVLQPLVSAGEDDTSLQLALVKTIENWGFDSFMYGVSASIRPNHESKSFVYTTLAREWVRKYDEKSYIEVDHRVAGVVRSGLPLLWDLESQRTRALNVNNFLDDALAHGVGSGLCFALRDERVPLGIIAFNSSCPILDRDKLEHIRRNLGDIFLMGHYFHSFFMKRAFRLSMLPYGDSSLLTGRQRECLSLAARGQTSQDIAFKLGITERTVEFHFCGIRSKLAASNRQEAIAKAVAEGIVHI